jgi:adenine-specific DNA-methyltransferase
MTIDPQQGVLDIEEPGENERISEALTVLKSLGFPRLQQNNRSALCLLALLDLTPGKEWSQADSPLIGITR